MILLLPRFVGPMTEPLFRRSEASVDEALDQVDLAAQPHARRATGGRGRHSVLSALSADASVSLCHLRHLRMPFESVLSVSSADSVICVICGLRS